MNEYIIIRSDTKNISYPMTKQEAMKTLKQYDKDGVSSFVISNKKKLNYTIVKS